MCINYGKLFETAGVNVGNTAAITLAQAGGEKDTQTLNSLVYTNSREDYESDEMFANFRAVTVGLLVPLPLRQPGEQREWPRRLRQ